MAIFHLHVKNISRRDGRSAVAAAAYRAGETLPNEREERDSAFGGRRDVLFSGIRLPEGSPAWMADRARLWNAVEAAEIRKDARVAKEIEFALPRELPQAEWLRLALAMADAYAVQGYAADVAVHDDGAGSNPHAHLMLTTRRINADGFGPKVREADARAFVQAARDLWAGLANAALERAGLGVQIDARSHAERGIARAPTVHRGPDREERRQKRSQRREEQRMTNPPDERDRRIAELEQANRALEVRLDALLRDQERDRPVPDPDGAPIAPAALREAEDRMLAQMEAPPGRNPAPPDAREAPAGEREAARAALDRMEALEVPERDADGYRLDAHENQLAWLDEPPGHDDRGIDGRAEGQLGWLREEIRSTREMDREEREERERER